MQPNSPEQSHPAPKLIPNWQPYLILLIGVIAVSSSAIFIRFAQNEHASSLVISAWRITLAALILTPIVLTRHRDELSKLNRSQLLLALGSGTLLALHFATWIKSLEYTSVITSVVLVNTNPLFVALAAPFFLRERIGRTTLFGIILAFIGGFIISVVGGSGSAPIQNQPLLGAFLAIIGALAVAGYFMIGRQVRAKMSLLPYIWLTYGSAAIVLCFAVFLFKEPVTGLSTNAYLWMTVLAIVPQLIGHSSYNYALGFLTAAYVSLTVLFEPVGSTILAAIFLNEQPLLGQLGGGVLILVALVLASRDESQRIKKVVEEEEKAFAAVG